MNSLLSSEVAATKPGHLIHMLADLRKNSENVIIKTSWKYHILFFMNSWPLSVIFNYVHLKADKILNSFMGFQHKYCC